MTLRDQYTHLTPVAIEGMPDAHQVWLKVEH